MDFTKVKRPKIGEKRLIHQIIINTKVESMLSGLRRCFVRDPIKPLRNDFNRLVITNGGTAVA